MNEPYPLSDGQNALTYNPPLLLRGAHSSTIYPSLFRKIDSFCYQRERIDTFDGDFLDLDWACIGSSRLVIISHGLEGSSHRAYVTGMARAMNRAGFDVLAWNFRSCSGEPNRLLRSYHNGVTEDLAWVIRHAEETARYQAIDLIGFSLGGNLTLNYLGREVVAASVRKAVVFSVPCDLKGSAIMLSKPSNIIYMKRFLRELHQKIRAKMEMMPHLINDDGYDKIKDFKTFDDRYTAPIHGFRDAEDYWHQCSSKPILNEIAISTLIVNAANDPFLSSACYPVNQAEQSRYLTLEIPKHGGHVGFSEKNREDLYWSEKRAVQWLTNGRATQGHHHQPYPPTETAYKA